MKFSILTFFITLFTCAYAAAVALPEDVENEALQAIERRDLEPVEHPDGTQELKVYDGETYEGSILVSEEGARTSQPPWRL